MRNLIFAALAAGAAVPSTAASVQSAISAETQQSDVHKPSGITVPAFIAGSPRVSIKSLDTNQLDVAATFRSPDGREVTSVYIFRNVAGSVPVWFDRSSYAVETSPMFGSVTAVIPATPFTPMGRPSNSGLRAVYTASGKGWISTALAFTQVGEWYVKIRSSSQTLSPQQMAERVDAIFSALNLPSEKAAVTAIAPISDCARPLPTSKPAKLVRTTQENSMLAALLGGAAQQVAAGTSEKPRESINFCREPGPARIEYAVYRPQGSDRHYTIALGDSGRAITVGADELGALVARGNAPLRYAVSYVELDRAFTFPQFDRLPGVEQAIQLVQTGTPLSSSTTWGKKEINITTGK